MTEVTEIVSHGYFIFYQSTILPSGGSECERIPYPIFLFYFYGLFAMLQPSKFPKGRWYNVEGPIPPEGSVLGPSPP